MTDQETQLRQKLARTTGLSDALLEQEGVVSFMRQRCRQLGLRDLDDYVQRVTQQEDELDLLVHQVAVAETWLFRYPASYELLLDHLRVYLQSAMATTYLRMLSVACATGEEAYSMAITAAAAGWPWSRIVVDAVDRQTQSLAIARRGVYTPRAHRESPPPWAKAWLHPADGRLQVDCRVMATVNLVVGDVLNTSFSPPARSYDIVFCRNLIIYLNPNAREQLVDRLEAWLRPDGLLFVGHAEHTAALRSRFSPIAVPHAFAMRPAPPDSAHARAKPVVAAKPARYAVRAEPDPQKVPLAGHSPLPSSARDGKSSGWSSTEMRLDNQRSNPNSAARPQSDLDDDIAMAADALPEQQRHGLEQARVQADNGELRQALSTLQSIMNTNPADPRPYELLGNIYLALQQLDQARNAFERLVYLSPNHTEALFQLALISEREGDVQQAVRYRQRAARSREAEVQE